MAANGLSTHTFQELIDDGVLEIGDGYRAKNNELGGNGPIFLRAGHVTDTYIDFNGVEHFHAELEDKVRHKMAQPGDTIVTTKGNSTGRTSFVTARMPHFVYSPHLSYWRSGDASRIENGFLRYWSRGREFADQLAGMKASTDMAPYLSLTDQRRLRITLPPLPEQRAIANILGSLDDKIELNRRMNATLEGIARALFKSWFVDFDPVRAKMDGRQPAGMSPRIAELFPGEFEHVNGELVPKEWQFESLGDVVELAYGKALKADARIHGDIPVFGSNGQVGWHNAKLVDGPGIIVGRKGNPGVVTWSSSDFFPIDTTFYVVPKAHTESTYYLFFALERQNLPDLGADSAVPGLNRNLAYMSQMIVPRSAVVEHFDAQVGALRKQIQTNEDESRTLASLRDTLLPKLLSGELRVPGAEQLVEEVV